VRVCVCVCVCVRATYGDGFQLSPVNGLNLFYSLDIEPIQSVLYATLPKEHISVAVSVWQCERQVTQGSG